jgi:hypothetical protein
MDQACSSLACFDPTHGHPIGGGRYWVEGFRTLSADLRDRCVHPRPIVLAGEGCSEGWLPHLDLMLSLQVSKERYANPNDGWEPIPFFQAVYHPYSVLYGNYSSLTLPPYDDLWPEEFAPKEKLKLLDRKFSQQFMLEQARSFLWGQQPAIANFATNQLTERREEIDYVLRLARLRTLHLKYLLHGTLLRPPFPSPGRDGFHPVPNSSSPSATGRDGFHPVPNDPSPVPSHSPAEMPLPLSRLSIYAGQQGSLTEFEGSTPAVLTAAWQAKDGSIGIFLANLSDSAQTVSLTLDRPDHPLPTRGNIFDVTQSRQPLGKFTAHHVALTVTILPKDVRIIELSK